MSDFKTICLLLILSHIIGDFYLQTEDMAHKKEEELKWVIFHSLIYAIPFLMIFIIVPNFSYSMLGVVVSTHFLIDVSKLYLTKSKELKLNTQRDIFIIDQALHTLVILFATYYICISHQSLFFNPYLIKVLSVIEIPGSVIFIWITKLLIIHKPSNIFVSKILRAYRPDEDITHQTEDNQGNLQAAEDKQVNLQTAEDKQVNLQDKNAGRMIGTLERTIMVIFLSIQQYPAVGLVLTAKSIARYDKISKCQSFAEYYLLGTLLSTIIAIIVSLI